MRPHDTLVLALLLTPALTGCIAVPSAPEEALTATADGSVLPTFGAPVLVGGGARAEASVAPGADGVLLACGHGRFRGPSPAWASHDGGATWSTTGPSTNPLPSGDCDVAVGDDGTWYVAYDTLASTTVSASRDEGATWTTNFVASLPTAGHTDRPWIQAAAGSLYLTYCNVMAVEPSACFFQRSDDDGGSWTTPVMLAPADPPEKVHALVGRLSVSDDGETVRVPYMRYTRPFVPDNRGEAYFEVATSTDAGATWRTDTVAGPLTSTFHFTSLSEAPDGTIYYAFATNERDDRRVFDLHIATSRQQSGWSPPLTVSRNVVFPYIANLWVDARPDGGALVAWHHAVTASSTPRWTVSAALVEPTGVVRPLGTLAPPETGLDEVEYLMVDHDREGLARIAFVRAGGDACSYLGRGHCVWMVTEKGHGVSR